MYINHEYNVNTIASISKIKNVVAIDTIPLRKNRFIIVIPSPNTKNNPPPTLWVLYHTSLLDKVQWVRMPVMEFCLHLGSIVPITMKDKDVITEIIFNMSKLLSFYKLNNILIVKKEKKIILFVTFTLFSSW